MTGASAATQVLNLLITSFGRDLLSLVGLVGVMVLQDPLLSIVTFVVFPLAMLVLRNMIKRIRVIVKAQFTGGTRILETLHETLQGIHIVKAFTLEDVLRERFDDNVAAVELEANKLARVANRTSPLMEVLGGFAMAGAVILWGVSGSSTTWRPPVRCFRLLRRSCWPLSPRSGSRDSISI